MVHVTPMQHAIIQMAVTSVTATLGTQAMDTPAIVCYDEIKSYFIFYTSTFPQILMSVMLAQPCVMVMPLAMIQMEAMNVFATLDTLEMDFNVQVGL